MNILEKIDEYLEERGFVLDEGASVMKTYTPREYAIKLYHSGNGRSAMSRLKKKATTAGAPNERSWYNNAIIFLRHEFDKEKGEKERLKRDSKNFDNLDGGSKGSLYTRFSPQEYAKKLIKKHGDADSAYKTIENKHSENDMEEDWLFHVRKTLKKLK